MKVYVAAPYPEADVARDLRDELIVRGHSVTSRWLDEPSVLNDEWAKKDLEDVAAADVLVALNSAEWADRGTGGRHVELGYSLAMNTSVVLVGEPTNIFHYLKQIIVVPDFDALFDQLARMEK